MINEHFTVKVNEDAKRYEFHSRCNLFNSYTVGFHEVDSLEDAYIAVWKALKKDVKPIYEAALYGRLNDIAGIIAKINVKKKQTHSR